MKTLILIGLIMINYFVKADICDICNCKIKNKLLLKVNCNKSIIDLTSIDWPGTNKSIIGNFSNIGLTYLTRITPSQFVDELIFENNEITTLSVKFLKGFNHLRKISLKNNKIKSFQHGTLDSASGLEIIDLTNNTINTIEASALNKLKHLKIVHLGYNKLEKFSPKPFGSSVTELYLNNNQIYDVVCESNKNSNLTYLDFSSNRLTTILTSTFGCFKFIKTLDLSKNIITNIEANAFAHLSNLETLYLNENHLTHIIINIPSSLKALSLYKNFIREIDFGNQTENLERLELQWNDMQRFSIFEGLPKLKFLNISFNKIEDLFNSKLPELEILDISFNQLISIPNNIFKYSNNLHTLILNENPIEEIYFSEKFNLKKLELKNMAQLQVIQANSFSGIHFPINESHCLELTISHCPRLNEIHYDAFKNLNLCKLDLSYNQFHSIPMNLTNWTNIKNGIDLQGNPFNCSCDAQWMLDIVLEYIYENYELQHYLLELRCKYPKIRSGKRLVKYYGHPGAFCNSMSHLRAAKLQIEEDDQDEVIKLKSGTGLTIIIVFACTILIATIATIVYTISQRRKSKDCKHRLLYE